MRLIALGGEVLMDGFALLGFETLVNPARDTVVGLVDGLIRERETALVFVETGSFELGDALTRARRADGRIVVVELPPLNAPEAYRPAVEELVARVLGTSALDPLA